MTIGTMMLFRPHNHHRPNGKGSAMASQIRGMRRSVEDYGQGMNRKTLESILEATDQFRESVLKLLEENSEG